ncbi:hypothetical protein COU57_02400 [Candidatus Pacearchaeota archaeon CG10_big_fil_rev_8_21_14_0_10_32_14]|nr:MAG: hypothetical protein COU57_02400 [Candidatus Pacearchaeota archaeon CG10_big_fil_rev_8_21_14_0_10_32_14]
MPKKCIYCSTPVKDDSVIDFCERCGVGVWGKKMFDTIVANMESARDNDDLVNNFQASATPPKNLRSG